MTSSGISSFLGYCFIFGILVALMTYLVISSPTSPEPQAAAVVSHDVFDMENQPPEINANSSPDTLPLRFRNQTLLQIETLVERLNRIEEDFLHKMSQVKKENQEQRDELVALKAQNDRQSTRIDLLEEKILKTSQMSKSSSKYGSADLEDSIGKNVDRLNNFNSMNEIPTSCQDLSFMGHLLNGFYLVKDALNGRKISAVYCDFKKSPEDAVENKIGYVDVKSWQSGAGGIHFYVQRQTPFATQDGVVPFEIERLNTGGAMNLTSGVFTAPVPGIYYFYFCGLKSDQAPNWLAVYLRLNGALVGQGYAPASFKTSGSSSSYYTLAFGSTLRLAKGDKIDLFKWDDGVLYDYPGHSTHFTGWLLEEELTF